MSNVQTYLVIGGIFLFSLLALNVNRTIISSEEQKLSAEYIVMATSVGQNLINEITEKAFDHNVIGNPLLSDINILTPPNLLGPEIGETLATFNDVDDYNYHTRKDSTLRGGTFDLMARVQYVNENNGVDTLIVISRLKRIQVTVTHPFMTDTVRIYSYKSY